MAFGVNILPLVTFTLPVIPAFLALLYGFGRFDGHFRDNVVFLYLLGGLGIGGVTSVLGVMLLVATPFLFAVSMPLVNALATTAFLNRPKWQGDRHTIFNGGAFGTGLGIVWGFALGYRHLGEFGVTPRLTLEFLLISAGLVFVHFAAAALIGSGIADRTPFRVILIAAVGILPVTVMVNEYVQGGVFLWPILVAAYGTAAFLYARHRVVPLGVSPEGRRAMRRRERANA